MRKNGAFVAIISNGTTLVDNRSITFVNGESVTDVAKDLQTYSDILNKFGK